MSFRNLIEENQIQNSNFKIQTTNTATNIDGVFAGGDCVNGGKEVVDAVQAGKDGAAAILEFLGIAPVNGSPSRPSAINDTISAGTSLPSDIEGNKFKFHQNLQ